MFIQFTTNKVTSTQYEIVDDWGRAFALWCQNQQPNWDHIVVVTDENVWSLYGDSVRACLSPQWSLVTLTIAPNESSKDFEMLVPLVSNLIQHRIHRRDLIMCIGGGVVCDLGGLLASLYMRGLNYVNVPTTMMAQIDAAIGGKVGANFGLRKNVVGGFHHPLLVLIDPTFLDSLPEDHFRTALAEAVKLAIASDEKCLMNVLENRGEALLSRDPLTVRQLIELCVRGKLQLLADDPYENDLNRVLNLGHGMAHALERIPIMPGERLPLHGEAVALGLAATIRYARRHNLCSSDRADRLLSMLASLHLPLSPSSIDRELVKEQLGRISEHRGGVFRLVVPVDQGVRILPHADLDSLLDCLYPLEGSLL
ncbi:MAG TPA: 3-dehydroquinate synthase family protein [Pyrinomonadaceae bacterium]